MAHTEVMKASAVIATVDPETLAGARSHFREVCQVSTVARLKTIMQECQSQAAEGAASEETRPDVILLDLNMPGMSGEEVLKTLRVCSSSLPILVLADTGEEARQSMEAGAKDFVLKPLRWEDLQTRTELLLQQYRQPAPASRQDAPMAHLVEKLHDPSDGHLDAKQVADFFGLSVAELARSMGRGVSTMHKTPGAPALQPELRQFEAMASGLLRLTGSERRARMWLQAANPALSGHAPVEWLRMGKASNLAEFIQDLLEGRPA